MFWLRGSRPQSYEGWHGKNRTVPKCMMKYFYNGVEDNSNPGFPDPKLILKPDLSFAEWNKSVTTDIWPEVEK